MTPDADGALRVVLETRGQESSSEFEEKTTEREAGEKDEEEKNEEEEIEEGWKHRGTEDTERRTGRGSEGRRGGASGEAVNGGKLPGAGIGLERELAWDAPARVVAAHRIVLAGLFLALVGKWSFFIAADRIDHLLPLRDDFFPAVLQSLATLRISFLGGLAAIVVSFFAAERWVRVACGWGILAAMSVLCLHQGSDNDMTFATAWWTALWSLWLVHRIDDADTDSTLRRAAWLSRVIVSMILLGGAIGKWTPEYWSGQVFHEIYFADRDFWVFNLVRQWFVPETIRELATWYSRMVSLTESACGVGLWMLPPRWAAAIAIVVFASIALLSSFLLFSVVGCLIALASVGFFVPSRATSAARGSHG